MNIPLEKQVSGASRFRFSLWLCILALLFVACAPGQSSTPVSGSEAAASVTETPVSEEEAPIVDATPTSLSEEVTPVAEATPTPLSEEEGGPSSGLSVGVIVVDFFGTGEEEGSGSSSNCLISPSGAYSEGQGGGHGSTGVTDGLITTNVEHGKLVYAHLKQLFGEEHFTEEILTESVPGLGLVERADLPEGTVYLAQVDIGKNFTDNVLVQIEGVRDILISEGVSYVVVNMSVVIKPCDNVIIGPTNATQYIQFIQCIEALKAIQDYFNEIGISSEDADAFLKARAEVAAAYYVSPVTGKPWGCPGDPGAEDVTGTLEQIIGHSATFISDLPGDPLYNAVQNSDGNWPENNTFYVAASGNDGYSYPYAPAIFRQVVSAGSFDSFPAFGYVPNHAEWIEGGTFEWILPEGATAILTTTQDIILLGKDDQVTFSGTSFAAPKVSYLTTMAMFRGADILTCYPQMIYAADKLPIEWFFWETLDDAVVTPEELEELYQGIWKNQTLDLLGCPDFLP